MRDQVDDITKGIGGGLIRGAAGAVGMVTDTLPTWLKQGSDLVARSVTGQSLEDQQSEQRNFSASVPQFLRDIAGGVVHAGKTETLQHGIEQATGPAYEPTTRAGKFAGRAAEFVPGAVMGSSWANAGRNALMYGVLPGLTSEGAGQVFEGGPIELAGWPPASARR
jgi:hypothetical protein